MAEKKEEKKEKGKEKEKSPRNNKVLFIAAGALALVVLIVGVGLGAYFLGTKKSAAVSPAAVESAAVEAAVGEAEQPAAKTAAPPPAPRPVVPSSSKVGPMVKIDDFVVNLLDRDATRYLKASVTFEVDTEEAAEEIKERMPQIRDAILLLVGNKNFNELRDLQGKMQLRAELIGQLNTILRKGQIKFIYFTNFVIQ